MDYEGAFLAKCELCPRRCRVNRFAGERGFCTIANEVLVAHWGPHSGEEPPISGSKGSGNVFFGSCNLRCVYCQNYQISHHRKGKPVSVDALVEIFFALEAQGCHNVNLVSPTPYIPFIAGAIKKAKARGITIPFVYNTNAYEGVEALRSLTGLIDIYLPDFKYWNGRVAGRLSGAGDYPESARLSIEEMKAQVGDLVVGKDGIARNGLLLRHLVLPGNLAGSREVIAWIHDSLGPDTWVSLMSQYYPIYKAGLYPILRRRVTSGEYEALINLLNSYGFENVFIQELESAPLFVPDFNKENPFAALSADCCKETG